MSLRKNLVEDNVYPLSHAQVSDCGRAFSIVLAVFGSLVMVAGLHRIYAGRYLTGLVMLCTLGGVFIWTLIDLLYLFSGSFLDSSGHPIKNWFVEDSD